MEGAIAAAIAGTLSLIGVIYANRILLKKTRMEQDTRMAEIRSEQDERMAQIHDAIVELKASQQSFQTIVESRLNEIEKKQDKYNNVIERTFKNEQDIAVLKAKGGIA